MEHTKKAIAGILFFIGTLFRFFFKRICNIILLKLQYSTENGTVTGSLESWLEFCNI
ncbi:MAG: hypothetical protein HPY66_0148 [Firmicutes bacterium]|nr:hypothetical protein [Bacillota bacterium]